MDIETGRGAPNSAPQNSFAVRPNAANFQHLAWSPDGNSSPILQGHDPKYEMYMHDVLWAVGAPEEHQRVLTSKARPRHRRISICADGASITCLVEDDPISIPRDKF